MLENKLLAKQDLFAKQNDVIVTLLLSWYSVSSTWLFLVFANRILTDKNTQWRVHLEITSFESKFLPFFACNNETIKFMPFVSNYVLINRGNFHLKLLHRFKDIAVFVVGSFILPHPVLLNVNEVSVSNTTQTKFNFCLRNSQQFDEDCILHIRLQQWQWLLEMWKNPHLFGLVLFGFYEYQGSVRFGFLSIFLMEGSSSVRVLWL